MSDVHGSAPGVRGSDFRIHLSAVVWIIFGIAVIQGLFGVPENALRLLPVPPELRQILALAIVAVFVALAIRWNATAAVMAHAFAQRMQMLPASAWLAGTILLGLVLRLGWLLAYPPDTQVSDHAIYSELATKLMRAEPYFIGNTHSYWPPGYPLFLAVWYAALGVGPWVIAISNLFLYIATVIVTWRLGQLLAGEGPARLAAALIAVWPNLIISVSLAKKELLLAVAVPLALLAYLQAMRPAAQRGLPLRALAAGILLGMACLAQPSFMLLPAAMLAFEIFGARHLARSFVRIAFVIAGMVAVIAPWTIRNYVVLDAFVPITTTGGDNFYSANNELATGGYISRYEKDLDQFDELTANKMGFEWGKQWIRENPGKFALLMLQKQIRLMGDDSDAAYWVVKAGDKADDFPYLVLKGLSNMFWWAFLLLTLVALVHHWRAGPRRFDGAVFVMLALLYVWAIDSVFQSGARHHVPLVPALAVLAGLLAIGSSGPANTTTRP